MTMRGISEASRHQAFVLTSRRRWDPRSIGSRPLHRLRPRHRFFGPVVLVNLFELEARLWTKRTTKSRTFRWYKFDGHARPTRRAVSKKVRSVYRTTFSERKSPLEARRRHPRSKEVTSSTTPFLKAHIPTNKVDNNPQEPRRKEATSTSIRPTSSSKNLLTWN